MVALYNTKIRPLLEYASPVWGGLPNYLSEGVQRVQDRSLSIIGVPRTALPALHERRSTTTKREFGKILKDESDPNNVFVKSAPKNQSIKTVALVLLAYQELPSLRFMREGALLPNENLEKF